MSASVKKNVLPEIYSSNVFMEQLKQTFLEVRNHFQRAESE